MTETRVENSLSRGMPATIQYRTELWRRRTGWFQKLEHDQTPRGVDPDLLRALGPLPLVVAGSTHAGEEKAHAAVVLEQRLSGGEDGDPSGDLAHGREERQPPSSVSHRLISDGGAT